MSKNAVSPPRHSSVKRGAALAFMAEGETFEVGGRGRNRLHQRRIAVVFRPRRVALAGKVEEARFHLRCEGGTQTFPGCCPVAQPVDHDQ